MENIGEIIKGFLWGTGFSLALLGFGTAYYLTVAIDVEDTFRDLLRVKVIKSAKEIESNYELNVSEIFKENNKVRITATIKNISKDEIYTHAVVVSTYDKKGKFIGNCTGRGAELTLAPQEISHIDIECNLFQTQAKRVESASLKISFR